VPARYETHRAQLKAILSSRGMPEENAEATADILSWVGSAIRISAIALIAIDPELFRDREAGPNLTRERYY
jgi:LDH2 family malate/lactate/ureidoglycolate dehydrogenase